MKSLWNVPSILVLSVLWGTICNAGTVFEATSPRKTVYCRGYSESSSGTITASYSNHQTYLEGMSGYSYNPQSGKYEIKVPYSFTVPGLRSAGHMLGFKGDGYNQSYWWVKYGYILIPNPDGTTTRRDYDNSERVENNVSCDHWIE